MRRQTCMAMFVALCWGVSGQIGSAQQPGLTEPKPIAGPRPIPLSEIARKPNPRLGQFKTLSPRFRPTS